MPPLGDEPTPQDQLAALHSIAAELARLNTTLRILGLIAVAAILALIFAA